MRSRPWIALLLAALAAVACESTTEVTEPGPRVVVSRVEVFPGVAVVETSQTRAFTFNVVANLVGTVFWSVDGGAGNGRITQDGLYTAPAWFPVTETITVRATSIEDQSTSGSAVVRVVAAGQGTLTVNVTPDASEVETGKTLAFAASVTGIDTTVVWSVDGGIHYGKIDQTGVYTAPLRVPYPSNITVRATSTVDAGAFGLATVAVIPAES
jgi:hypothetical protein